MTLRLFGLGKKGKDKGTPEPAAPTGPATQEPVEFQEVPGAPAAASANVSNVPSAIGNAKALRATRAATAARPRKAAKKTGAKLTKKQLAQRKYAAGMKQVRKRAKTTKGGKGRIAKRSGATKLRRQLGLKAGKKSGRKKR